MPEKIELSDSFETTRSRTQVRIPNPLPDDSKYWTEVLSKINPRLRRAVEIGFADGKLGHRCRPLTQKEVRLLTWATAIHPGVFFWDEEGDIIGAHLCPCTPCAQRISAFCMETGVNLIAQQRGDFSYTRTDDNTVEMVECLLGEHENRQQLQTASLAGNVALQVSEMIAQRVKEEVSRQLRAFFDQHTRNIMRSMRQNSLIQSAFQTQADMLRSDPDEVQ